MKSKNKLISHIPTLLSLYRGKGEVYGDSAPLSQKELNKVSASLLSLQRGLTGKREYVGASYMQNNDLLGAYLLYYWSVSYTQISSIIKTLPKSVLDSFCGSKSDARELKILDLGSGPAPASCAILDNFQNAKCFSVTLADYSPNAMELGKKIIRKSDSSIKSLESFVCNFEKDGEKSLSCFAEKKYDIIVMSHVLNELWKDENAVSRRKSFVCKVESLLSDGGILILCEPALLKTSRELMALRDSLVSDYNEKKNDIRLVSPCLSSCSQCPALLQGENITCHHESSWDGVEPASSIAKCAKLDRDSVKMTYFVFEKQTKTFDSHVLTASQVGTANAVGTVNYVDTGNVVGTGNYVGTFSARVVSDQMLNKSGRVRYVLCDGKKRFTLSAKKDDSIAKSKNFFCIKRYDVINVKDAEDRCTKDAESYGITSETEINVPL